jgi:hypothetical protein
MATRSAAGQNLDEEHFALLANRTLRQRMPGEFLVPLPIVLGGGGFRFRRGHSEKLTAQGEFPLSATIGEEAVVPNPLEAFRKHVHQEPADELLRSERHCLALVIVAIVLPDETHSPVLDVEYALVADSHTVGISRDVPEDGLWSVKGSFGVDDPLRAAQRSEIAQERSPCSQRFQGGEELQLAGIEGLFEGLQEQAPE